MHGGLEVMLQCGMIPPRVRRVLPWLVALGIMGYLLWTVSFRSLLDALGRGNLPGLIGVALFVDLGCLTADSFATSRVMSWFLVPLSFSETLPARAASYLMAVLNYNLGQAGFAYYLHRRKRVSLAALTGVVLMMMGTVVLLLGVLSSIGVLLGPGRLRGASWVLAAVALATFAYAILLAWRPGRLRRLALFAPLLDAGILGHLKATLVRIPHVAVLIVAHFLAMRCFHIRVPLDAGLVLIPVTLLIGTLPLTPFGLGTMQLAAVHFFAAYAPGDSQSRQAAVLAYSLSLSTIALGIQVLIGLAALPRVTGMYEPSRSDEA